jgi:hypothetical protein
VKKRREEKRREEKRREEKRRERFNTEDTEDPQRAQRRGDWRRG